MHTIGSNHYLLFIYVCTAAAEDDMNSSPENLTADILDEYKAEASAADTDSTDEIEQEHWDDIDLHELSNDFNGEDMVKDKAVDLGMVAEKLNCEDAETTCGNNESNPIGRSLLHFTMFFYYFGPHSMAYQPQL